MVLMSIVQNPVDTFFIPSPRATIPFENVSSPTNKRILITAIVICVIGILVTSLFASGLFMPASSTKAIIAMAISGGITLISLGAIASILLINQCSMSRTIESSQRNDSGPLMTEEGMGPAKLFKEGNDAADVHMNILKNYLSVQDLGVLAQVNKYNSQAFQPAIISKAKQFGYTANDFDAAKAHLTNFLKEIRFFSGHKIFDAGLTPEKIALGLRNSNKQEIFQLLITIYGKPSTGIKRKYISCPLLMRYISKLMDDQVIVGKVIWTPNLELYEILTNIVRAKHEETLTLLSKIGISFVIPLEIAIVTRQWVY